MISCEVVSSLQIVGRTYSGKVVITSEEDVIDPANTGIDDGGWDVRLAGTPAELLTGHKIGPVHVIYMWTT